MAFVVVYDASVLYPNTLRDLLIRIAQSGLAQAKWTEQILDEMFAALQRQRPDLDQARLARTRTLMGTAVRDWRITGYDPLIDSLKLPDPDDRHVLAAAIRARAQVIVTSNLRHFPIEELRAWDIDPKSPDEFVRDQISLDRRVVYAAVQQIADSWRNPPGGVEDVLDRLERSGLGVSVAELRAGG
ncbi:PIN domain-containing protein [Plantactinospora soyae]|uniref:Nucleic acid-binding protein n=1 Tax=Plantactinospora soyae TaxID=1544732 RepID=A0A927QWP1_9ACTN|nr:PIN domain-containing protein [Plantactinospora soyae]MBE1487140.1 putative nucleic acid-binding protein [Plantactinospora soyae]